MRLGVLILPELSWPAGARRWRRAEELGLDAAWTYDHLAWGPLRDASWFGAVPTLAAAAAITSRIRLGTLVATPNFRHPVPFARELITLDDVSAGRLTLGMGAGSSDYDAATTRRQAWSPLERAERFAEFVELLDELLRRPVTNREGRFYSAFGARSHPGCAQRPRIPFAIAGNGPRGMRLAAAHAQTWVTLGEVGPDGGLLSVEAATPILRRQQERVDAACLEVGRDPATLRRLILGDMRIAGILESLEAYRDAAGRLAELGFADLVVHWPRPEAPFRGDEGVLEQCAAEALPAS